MRELLSLHLPLRMRQGLPGADTEWAEDPRMLRMRSDLGGNRLIGFGLFILIFFTLPVGISEDQPLLIVIPIVAFIAAIMIGDK